MLGRDLCFGDVIGAGVGLGVGAIVVGASVVMGTRVG